jgi:tripartite-type tricarboxylate transporter receptor subunit TctC
MKRLSNVVTLVALLQLVCLLTSAYAEYPEKAIEYYIPFSAGGVADLSSRALCTAAEKYLGQPFKMNFKTGAGGRLMVESLLKATPDGYTIGMVASGSLARVPHMMKVTYDPFKDFTFIMQFGVWEMGYAVKKEAPWNSLKDLVEYARKNPNKVTISCPGPKTPQDLATNYIAKIENIKLKSVPFKGGQEAVTALLGGHVTAACAIEFPRYIESGKIKLLATLGSKRWYPDVPTLTELGYNLSLSSNVGIIGPAGMSREVVTKLQDAFHKAMEDKGFISVMADQSNPIHYRNAEEFAKVIRVEYDNWAKIMKELSIEKQ